MPRNLPRHVIVDGSNIATEGRSHPSLKQLDEAVSAFMAENPDHTVTVVVDATFGHRIDKAEVAAFDAAIDANELVSPPAGAIGRGDAFVLQIADKADAMVLSNDSFQEFHGEYDWLFDEGRLMGGKPVPAHRMGVRAAQPGPRADQPPRAPLREEGRRRAACEEARRAVPRRRRRHPCPCRSHRRRRSARRPKLPQRPQRRSRPRLSIRSARPPTRSTRCSRSSNSSPTIPSARPSRRRSSRSPRTAPTRHPSRCAATSRFGISAKPAPRSAREVLTLGNTMPFTVVSIAAGRRGVDLAMPGFEPDGVVPTDAVAATAKKAAAKKAALRRRPLRRRRPRPPRRRRPSPRRRSRRSRRRSTREPRRSRLRRRRPRRRRLPQPRRRRRGRQRRRRWPPRRWPRRRLLRPQPEAGRAVSRATQRSIVSRSCTPGIRRRPSSSHAGRARDPDFVRGVDRRAHLGGPFASSDRRRRPHRRRHRRATRPRRARRGHRCPPRSRRPRRRAPRRAQRTPRAGEPRTTSPALRARRVLGMCSGGLNGSPTAAHSAPMRACTSARRPFGETRRPTAGSSGWRS